MTKKNILLLAIGALFTACTGTQLTPSDADVNYFEVDASDTSAEGKLRRDFYKETGAYLLFSDTLRRGDKTLTVDPEYSITITGDYYHNNYLYKYEYLQEDKEKLAAADFLRGYIVKYASAKALPYSFLVVKEILQYPYDKKLKEYDLEKSKKGLVFIQGMYTSAVAGLAELTDDASRTKTQQLILNTMVKTALKKEEEDKFEKFYAYSLPYYDKSYDSDNISEMPDVKDLKELGFLKAYSFKPKKRMSFYAQNKDKEVFIDELLKKSAAKWRQEYKDYPLVVGKLETLLAMTKSLGFDLSYLDR